MTVDHSKFSAIELIYVRYAENRIAIREITKKINALTDWKREDKGVHLDEIRNEYRRRRGPLARMDGSNRARRRPARP